MHAACMGDGAPATTPGRQGRAPNAAGTVERCIPVQTCRNAFDEDAMDYKTILVHIDATPGAQARAAFAARLALAHGAHVTGLAQTGISRFLYESTAPGADFGALAPLFEQLRADAETRTRQFDAAMRQAGVASFEHRIDDEEPAAALAFHALYADLAIVGGDPDDMRLPGYVALNAPCPLLMLPQAAASLPASADPAFGRVLVAWNASPQAARAVRFALPLLARARDVEVAIFTHDEDAGSDALEGVDIGAYLARHGVAADIRRQRAPADAGTALLALAGERQCDLLVMGCYGHSRFREILLGGASRTVLGHANLPVLLAH